MALIPPVMYNAQIYSIPLSRQTYVSLYMPPFPFRGKKRKKKNRGREGESEKKCTGADVNIRGM